MPLRLIKQRAAMANQSLKLKKRPVIRIMEMTFLTTISRKIMRKKLNNLETMTLIMRKIPKALQLQVKFNYFF